jgi:hypothetical protein
LLCVNAISVGTFSFECESLAASHHSLTRPALHYVFSLGLDESKSTSDEKIVAVARAVIESEDVGMKGHQALYVTHRDTENLHCHVVVSAVHPLLDRTCRRAGSLKAFSFACRRAEIRFQMKSGRGAAVAASGGRVVDWSTKEQVAEWRAERVKKWQRSKRERLEDRSRNAAIEQLRTRAHDRGIDRGLER